VTEEGYSPEFFTTDTSFGGSLLQAKSNDCFFEKVKLVSVVIESHHDQNLECSETIHATADSFQNHCSLYPDWWSLGSIF